MIQISNSDYDKIIKLLPKVLELIPRQSSTRKSEPVRQLKLLVQKWNRKSPKE